MTQKTQRAQGGGNTKLRPTTTPRSRKYCFTYNNYTHDTETQLIKDLERYKGVKYLWGHERGDTGTPHLQGYVEFKNPIAFTSLQKINPRIHWETCKGSTEANITYCSKQGDIVTNHAAFKMIKSKKPLKEIKLWLQWQQDVVEIIKEEPDDRTVHWYWESEGNSGKTTLMRYLIRNHGAIPLEGKKNDILYCAAEHESEIYVYDIERSLETYVSYGAIEKIKNGCFMCAKYESKPIDRNPPHVVVMANFAPDEKKLSHDRWHIVNIDKSKVLTEEVPHGTSSDAGHSIPSELDTDEAYSISSEDDE